ncbi:hypothetical protein [Pelagicoccus sp. SDUM812002]|uniref:hypothetical protein n=1 Tax=Pelagicoccus sp. SDUM812002 TaxID=3041266 RepID=UPI00280D5A61|nr:hypothetical protein [Pelagicoccus sp. SDUM812002]MDQ8185867.1 hypothetical protein [Pelagicoccus sp. SDUM812002]
MSLNRYEQLLFDYIESLPEERRFWFDRVVQVAETSRRRETAALILNSELWEYFEERSRHEAGFADVVGGGLGKLSMLNLSEHLLRMWSPVFKTKKT